MPEFNRQLGAYTLIRKIGSGGMAEVWMAVRPTLGAHKTVAIKLLNALSREKPEFRQMFLDEARLSMSLNNSSIVQVFDAGECDGECFMVMELIDGMNLSQLNTMLWERGERLPLDVAAYVVGELLRALDHAHNVQAAGSASIVHRDVSPQNVMLSVAGEVKLMDFGVARFATEETQGLHIKGKLRYMPPEQLQGNSRDPTVDLFAVGAVLYELLEGARFRDGCDEMQMLTMIMKGETPPLSDPERLPAQLVKLMNELLQSNAQIRIGSARGALRMLSEWPGYRNAAIALESYVTRLRDLIPPTVPITSTSSRGDMQAQMHAQAATDGSSQGGTGSQRSWRGVNPATDTTLDQLDGDAIDDTNIGSLWPARTPTLTRAAAVLVAALGLSMGAITFHLALNASPVASEDQPELDRDVHATAEPAPASLPASPAPEPASTPTPTPEAEAPSEPSEPSAPPDSAELTEDELTFDPPPPPPPPKEKKIKQKVKVTFVANEYRFVYVKVAGQELALEPSKTTELLEGGHTIYMRTSKSEDYQKVGRGRFRPGHDYQVRMTQPGGFKIVQTN